jgi:hypothetical protein
MNNVKMWGRIFKHSPITGAVDWNGKMFINLREFCEYIGVVYE